MIGLRTRPWIRSFQSAGSTCGTHERGVDPVEVAVRRDVRRRGRASGRSAPAGTAGAGRGRAPAARPRARAVGHVAPRRQPAPGRGRRTMPRRRVTPPAIRAGTGAGRRSPGSASLRGPGDPDSGRRPVRSPAAASRLQPASQQGRGTGRRRRPATGSGGGAGRRRAGSPRRPPRPAPNSADAGQAVPPAGAAPARRSPRRSRPAAIAVPISRAILSCVPKRLMASSLTDSGHVVDDHAADRDQRAPTGRRSAPRPARRPRAAAAAASRPPAAPRPRPARITGSQCHPPGLVRPPVERQRSEAVTAPESEHDRRSRDPGRTRTAVRRRP